MARRPADNSVFDEPHFRPADDASARGDGDGASSRSVWDEPSLSSELAGAKPHGADDYAFWLRRGRATTEWGKSWLTTIGLAMIAGPLAVVGAFWGGGGALGILTMVVIGPAVEEVVKVMAPLIMVERRPFVFRSGSQIMACAMLSGLAFAVIENFLYLHVYVPDPSPQLVQWRWTVCVMLHVGCSTIAGLAVLRIWRDVWQRHAPARTEAGFALFIAAIVIHGGYNLFALLLESILHPF